MRKTPAGLRDLTTKHLECRHLNHSWQVQSAQRSRSEVQAEYRCSRCKGWRIDVYDRDATSALPKRRRYIYPETYLVADLKSWGGRATFNGNVRAELLRRYVGGR